MIDVFFGESRTYIKDTLMQKLGWSWRSRVFASQPENGLYRIRHHASDDHYSNLYLRDGKYCFDLKIPGVSRGRLNGARGVVGKVENGVLVIDVRELLAPHKP